MAQGNFLTKLGNENVLSIKIELNIYDATNFCHNMIGGKFPTIYSEQNIDDFELIGLNNFFLDVKPENNSGKILPLNKQGTYQWSNGSFLQFSPWTEGNPNCTNYCCVVLYSERRIYDSSCKEKLANMVCILPDVENITDEERKQLVEYIHESSNEDEVKAILQTGYRQFKNVDGYTKQWMNKKVYFNPKLDVTFYEARSMCTAMGGKMPSVHSREEMNELTDLIDGEPSYLGVNPEDNSGKGSSPFNKTTTYTWQDGSPFEDLGWYPEEPRCRRSCCSVVLFHLSIGGVLSDYSCSTKLKFTCIITDLNLPFFTSKAEIIKNIRELKGQHFLIPTTIEEKEKSFKEKLESLEESMELMRNETLSQFETQRTFFQQRSKSLQNEIKRMYFILFLFISAVVTIVIFSIYCKRNNNWNNSSRNLNVSFQSNGDDSSTAILPRL